MTDEEAQELGRRAIFHATHRDAASGGIIRVYHVSLRQAQHFAVEVKTVWYLRIEFMFTDQAGWMEEDF
jgi:20S proteasome alpha/beta subunit